MQLFSQFDSLTGLPIRGERITSFTTSEGSYMNIDISPDGKTLLFDLLGDIYSLSSSGGKAKQMTRNIALNLRPTWSPDGKRFGYVSDAQNGICFHVRDVEGRFDSIVLKDVGYGADIKWDTPLSLKDPDEEGYYSPNGRWRAVIKDTNETKSLILSDLINGKHQILISSLLQKPYSYRANVPSPHFAFSPDSRYIFIAFKGKIHRINIGTGKDEIIPFIADVRSNQGEFVYNTFRVSYDSTKVRYIRSINRSPDGQQLVFSALGRLHLMNLSTGNIRNLTSQSYRQFQPVFSPDGKWIAYVSWSDTLFGHLWRVPVTGGNPQQLTRVPGRYLWPAWSPDGKQIAVIKGEPSFGDRDFVAKGNLELISVTNDTVIVIDRNVPVENQLSFSLDGKRIFYMPEDDWHQDLMPQLVSKSMDGSNKKVAAVGRLTFSKDYKQRKPSPDGRHIVYSLNEDLYLVRVTDTINETVLYDEHHEISGRKIANGIDPYWEQEGKILSWTFGNQFFSVAVDNIADSGLVRPDRITDININASTNYGRGVIALKNIRIVSMKGDEVIQNGAMVIKDGRIEAIGSASTIRIPEKARLFDLKGKTVIPGFIDLHCHMRVLPDVFPQQSWMFLANLAYGVTTARDPAQLYDSYGYAELLRTGDMIGPRLYTVGKTVSPKPGIICNNLDDARSLVNKRAAMGSIAIKQYMLRTRKERQLLLLACKEAGVNMTNEGGFQPLDQFGMIKDGSTGIEHNPEWGDIYEDVTKFYAKSGVYFTPTLQVSSGNEPAKEYLKYKYWREADAKMKRFIKSDTSQKGSTGNGAESLETILSANPKDTIERAFLAAARINARMLKAGANIALGSHGNNEGIGVHNELWALQMGGISNMEALRAATITGAKALGLQNDIGSLERGKIADLIILNKNPLDDILNSRDIQYVMKDGVLYDGNTLDEIWPTRRATTRVAQ